MSTNLTTVFVEAFEPYLRSRLTDLGVDEDVGLAIAEAVNWLRTELDALLGQPFHLQRRGPLEVVQEAMKFPTAALDKLEVRPADRDPVAASALPGDLYGLAPVSSRELGEEAWAAHLAWGAAKAAAFRERGSTAGGHGD